MTFNRLANIQYSRLKNKVLTDALQEPTIPIIATAFQPITEEDYLVLGEFLETDILDGELVINTESDRVWVRSNDSIIELNTTTASGFRPLTTNHIWIGESGLAKEYNLGSGFLVGTNSVSVSGMSLTGGNGITIGSASTIDLGGDLTGDVIINGNSYSMYIGNYGPDTQLTDFSVGANDQVSLYSYENNQISSALSLGTNFTSLSSNVKNGNVYVTGHTAMMSGYDNRKFALYLYGSGIGTGSGEYFVINGVTFSEGVDFIGSGDPVLDAETIAGLTYSGVPDFISVDYTIGFTDVFFNFSNPAVVSGSFSSATFAENQFNTQLSLNQFGAILVSGNNGLVINNVGEHKFNDTEPNPKGLQYGGNYDATLVDDSLVPKRYVDDSISTISLTGGNGISIGASGSIDLGGTLTQPTILLGNNQTFDLGTTASPLSFLRIEGIQSTENYKFGGEGLSLIKNPATYFSDMDYTGSLDTRSFIQQTPNIISSVVNTNSTYEQTQITQSPNQVDILVRVNGADDSGFVLNQLTDNFSFIDKRLTPRGLEYQDDYSANFSVRSLVDKNYVDTNIAGLSFSLINDLTPQLGGNLDLNNFNIGGTGSIDIEGNVIADMIQLKGGVGTQGEMSWDLDEETIALIMDGTTQHIGQDTYIHARNNTGSIITKGTTCMATGTLGASGRITIAPMVADGSVEARYYIGVAAENIGIGEDGKVSTFGKIRQIDLTNFNDGDVLWLDPTIAGGLTASIPTAPNLKIATAFVIHAASNGTLFVRVEQGTDLHNDQRVEVSGLTAGQFLGWDNTNQRWENKTPTDTNFANTNLTFTGNRSHELNGSTLTFTNSATGFLRLNTFNEIFTFGKGDTTNLYFGNNVLRNITTGLQNVIVGNDINGITTGQVNTFVGFRAGQNINNSGNTLIGGFAAQTLTSGANNVVIGRSATFLTNSGGAVTNLENSIVIGETARVLNSGDTNTIVIGRNSRGYGSNTAVLGNVDITLTRLRGRVEMNQITSQPTITDNSSYAIWFNSSNPIVRLKDSLGVESNITLWNNNNDGIGSGLNADLLDNQEGTYYLDKANHTGNTRQTKSICIENPQIGDRIPFLQKPDTYDYTITRITASVLTDTNSSNSSNQVSYEIYNAQRIYQSGFLNATHTATPDFSDATIVDPYTYRFMWVKITNVVNGDSNVKYLLLTIEYTTDY